MTAEPRGERRRWPRVGAGGLGWVAAVRLRPGVAVTLVDLSGHGALVETASCVRPGARATLCVEHGGRSTTAAATVARSAVATLDRHRGAVYRVALRFDTPVTWPAPSSGKRTPGSPAMWGEGWGSRYPSGAADEHEGRQPGGNRLATGRPPDGTTLEPS